MDIAERMIYLNSFPFLQNENVKKPSINTTKTPNQQPEECSLKNMNIPPTASIIVDDREFSVQLK